MEFSSNLPLHVLIATLAAAFGTVLGMRFRNDFLRDWSGLIGATFATISAGRMIPHVLVGRYPRFELWGLAVGEPIALGVDELGLLYLLVQTLLWSLAAIYSVGYLRGDERQGKHHLSYTLAMGCAQIVAMAGNLTTMVIGFELLSVFVVALMLYKLATDPEHAAPGTKTYVLYAFPAGILASAGLIACIILTDGNTTFVPGGFMMGTAPLWILHAVALALLIGFSVKAALMPLHGWLPIAMFATAPVSAAFHAVAVVKSGVFAVLRLSGWTFGPEYMDASGFAGLLAVLALASILLASMRAFGAKGLKQRLAYSTIGELAYITGAAFLLSHAALVGAMFHLVAHAFGKITLFLGAGAIEKMLHKKVQITDLGGIGRIMPVTMTAFTLGVLSLAGFPLLGAGILSKWFLCLGALQAEAPWFAAGLIISGIMKLAYLGEIPRLAFFPKQEEDKFKEVERNEAHLLMVVPIALTAICSVALGVVPQLIEGVYALASTAAVNVVGAPAPTGFVEVLPVLTMSPAYAAVLALIVVVASGMFPGVVPRVKDAAHKIWTMRAQLWRPGKSGVALTVTSVIAVALTPTVLHIHHGWGLILAVLWWAWFGEVGCRTIVAGSKLAGMIVLQRPDDWYQSPSAKRVLPMAAVSAVLMLIPCILSGFVPTRILARIPVPDMLNVSALPPAAILVMGALLVAIWPRRLDIFRPLLFIVPSVVSLAYIGDLAPGAHVTAAFLDLKLQPMFVDKLSILFGGIVSLVGIIGGVFAFGNNDREQQISALIYGAGALGVVFARDLITLFVFWELMTLGSTDLVMTPKKRESKEAGWSYLLVHFAGGGILLAGILLHYFESGSIAFEWFDPKTAGLGPVLIGVGFAVNAGILPLSGWLARAYSNASITGAGFCASYTTKVAVYVLVRGFLGWDILVGAGLLMALWNVVNAVLADDIRELLAYHILSQVGYMILAIGLGTEIALVAMAAHAICHILYKGVLMNAAGAVIETTGRSRFHELGGLFWRQPGLFILYSIGALSISGFPLFNGFVSKSMITAAAHDIGAYWAFLGLMLASVGTFLHTGLKVVWEVWFGPAPDRSIENVKPTPKPMAVGIGMGAFMCTFLGCLPQYLYRLMPFEVHWSPWTLPHFVEMVPLLTFTAVAFFAGLIGVLRVKGPSTVVDCDALYRELRPAANTFVDQIAVGFKWAKEAWVYFLGLGPAIMNIVAQSPAAVIVRVPTGTLMLAGVMVLVLVVALMATM